jgi:hypothetical protein
MDKPEWEIEADRVLRWWIGIIIVLMLLMVYVAFGPLPTAAPSMEMFSGFSIPL